MPEEIAKRLAAAGVTGEAAKQMMAAVKGGGRKYPSLVPCSLASHHTDAVMADGVTIMMSLHITSRVEHTLLNNASMSRILETLLLCFYSTHIDISICFCPEYFDLLLFFLYE